MLFRVLVLAPWLALGGVYAGDEAATIDAAAVARSRKPEDAIPVIEITGEGAPMTSAQIRALEEAANGAPLDIKVEKTWRPTECPKAAGRKDWVTFHYKVFTEDGKKVDQTYGRGPITMQLGTGWTVPGLDKGLKGMCDTELRSIRVPYRLAQRKKCKVWKHVPTDEHWLRFDVEMLTVEPWSVPAQFAHLDLNNDTFLTEDEIVDVLEHQRGFGKTWSNEDIDNRLAARYYIQYFDGSGDDRVCLAEFEKKIANDEDLMKSVKKVAKKASKLEDGTRRRDPSIGWILDFDNDGYVTREENDLAAERIEKAVKDAAARRKEEL